MSQYLFEKLQRRFAIMNAAVLANPSEMVRQMALPLIPERRVKGALEVVSRDTGLTYSKAYRLFYGNVRDVWRNENQKLTAAFKRFAVNQERLYRERADKLSAINAEIERLERQSGFDLDSDQEVVG